MSGAPTKFDEPSASCSIDCHSVAHDDVIEDKSHQQLLYSRLGDLGWYLLGEHSYLNVALEAIGVQGMRHCHSSTELVQSEDDTDGCAEDTSLVSFLEDDTCPEGFVHAAVESRLEKLCWVIRALGLLTAIVFYLTEGSMLYLAQATWTGPLLWTIALWSPIALIALGTLLLVCLALYQQGGCLLYQQIGMPLRAWSFCTALVMFVYCLEPNVSPDVRQERILYCTIGCLVSESDSILGSVASAKKAYMCQLGTGGQSLTFVMKFVALIAHSLGLTLLLISEKSALPMNWPAFCLFLSFSWLHLWAVFFNSWTAVNGRTFLAFAMTLFLGGACYRLLVTWHEERQESYSSVDYLSLYLKNQMAIWVTQLMGLALVTLCPNKEGNHETISSPKTVLARGHLNRQYNSNILSDDEFNRTCFV